MAAEGRAVPEPPWDFEGVAAGYIVFHVDHRKHGWQVIVAQSLTTGDGIVMFRDDNEVTTYVPIADIACIKSKYAPEKQRQSDES